jgi:hypothetical protein
VTRPRKASHPSAEKFFSAIPAKPADRLGKPAIVSVDHC